jgi:hypothetical protein
MMKTTETPKTNSWMPRNPTRRKVGVFDKFGIGIAFILLPFLWGQPACGVTIDPLTPAPGTSGLSAPPEMKAWVSGLGGQGATVRLYRRVAPLAKRPDFTIAVLPDTQFYTGAYDGAPSPKPEIFYSQTDWIVANRSTHNIVMTLQLGDIVLRGENRHDEWARANNAMSRLENPITTGLSQGMPYSICVADHDGVGDYLTYNQYFGVNRFAGRSYYGGHCGANNNNHYSFFSASGMDFIVLSLEMYAGAKPSVMAWANDVLAANANRRAIVISHSLMYPNTIAYPGGRLNPAGVAIYDAIKGNPNVFMMHCGHDSQFANRTYTHNGNSIVCLMSDYSNEPNGGNGWMRLMRFVPSSNQIQVKTYSPWLNQNKSTVWHEFSLPYDMTIPDPAYSLVATRTATADGIINFGTFTDLVKSTSYDWHVTVEQAGVVTKSSIWSFNTALDFSLINYPPVAEAPPFSEPLALEGTFQTVSGYPAIIWKSKGGRRYRVEYKNEPGAPTFIPIVRSIGLETDPAPAGTESYLVFVDDGSLTGGVSTSRVYQVREMAPVQPLKIMKIIKPVNGNPAIMWHSVGGRRYRVEYCNGGGNGLEFHEIPRSMAAETDAAPEGSASSQTFVDDGTLTGGVSGSRFYRVREVP